MGNILNSLEIAVVNYFCYCINNYSADSAESACPVDENGNWYADGKEYGVEGRITDIEKLEYLFSVAENYIKYRIFIRETQGEDEIFLVKSESVKKGYLHDTYDGYGQVLDSNMAEDWCLDNTDCDYGKELSSIVKEKFNLPEDFYVEYDGSFERYYDDFEISDSLANEIESFIENYNEENESFTEAEYINYWDGNNRRSIIIDAPAGGEVKEIENEDAMEIIANYIIARGEGFKEDGIGYRSAESSNYRFTVSAWGNDAYAGCFVFEK